MKRRSLLAGLFAAPMAPMMLLTPPVEAALPKAATPEANASSVSHHGHISLTGGRFSRAEIEEMMRGIDAALKDGRRFTAL